MPEDEAGLAYIAGIFDGEGGISFKTGTFPNITITNTDEKLIAWLMKMGGRKTLLKNKGKPCWHWCPGSRKNSVEFLVKIEPYLIIKRERVQRGIAIFQESWDMYVSLANKDR